MRELLADHEIRYFNESCSEEVDAAGRHLFGGRIYFEADRKRDRFALSFHREHKHDPAIIQPDKYSAKNQKQVSWSMNLS